MIWHLWVTGTSAAGTTQMLDTIAHIAASPVVLLYQTQAATYVAASMIYRTAGHRDLGLVYLASAALHFAFAACHALHIG